MGLFDKVKKTFKSDGKDDKLEKYNEKEEIETAHLSNQTNDKKSFKYLDNLIHSGEKEIFLDSNIMLDDDESSQYKDGIRLDIDDLIINGQGYTIDAKNRTRIFECLGKNITIRNMTLANGIATWGGAILNRNNLTIEEITLKDNSSKRTGGAINNYGGTLTVIKSKFENNSADRVSGAINNFQGSLTIIESEFKGNEAQMNAGAIHNHIGNMSISKSNFMANKAKSHGGAINNFKGRCAISESRFEENEAKASEMDGHGGAISNSGDMAISKSSFEGNMATRYGGGLYNESDLSIIESNFMANLVRPSGEYVCGGGGLYNNGDMAISKSTVTRNIAECDGGGLYNGKSLKIEKCKIANNSASWTGGAIYSREGEMTIADSEIMANTAKSGGAIYNMKGLKIADSTLTQNTAENEGGAIYNWNELTISNSTLTQNSSRVGGAIYNRKHGSLNILDSKITKNQSPSNIVYNAGTFQSNNVNFSNNQSKDIILNEVFEESKSSLSVFYGEFIDNEVSQSVICNRGRSCTIEKSAFKNNLPENDAKNNLSGNDAKDIINQGELTLISPEIKDKGKTIANEAYILIRRSYPGLDGKIHGEGTVEYEGDMIPDEEKFDFEYLDKMIHESGSKEITLKEDIIFESYERYFYEGGIELDIDNLTINGNGRTIDARDKTRIFLITADNITLKNITFRNGHSYISHDNFLNAHGGAIRIIPGNRIRIENCRFIDNSSEGDSGAIANNGELTVIESDFNGNSSKGKGGAIENESQLEIMESTFSENVARGELFSWGGAIYNSNELKIGKSKFMENMARWGGAIHNGNGNLIIRESSLNDNKAEDGGAINNYANGKVTIIKSSLENNMADGKYTGGDGGAIANSGELTIIDSSINENTATGKFGGGAIFLKNSRKYESDNCTFKDNEPDDIREYND